MPANPALAERAMSLWPNKGELHPTNHGSRYRRLTAPADPFLNRKTATAPGFGTSSIEPEGMLQLENAKLVP